MAAFCAAAGCNDANTRPERSDRMQATEVHAAVRWLEWGPEIFERAKSEDKLILLDSGATWCHWCHVMDRVTYEDAEVVRLINEKFIPVRIDRDRLPDVDAHYQRTVGLVNPQQSVGGWPLTVLITPEGQTLYKATFLPPRAGGEFAAPYGLVDVLTQLDRVWRDKRRQIAESAERFGQSLAQQHRRTYVQPGELSTKQWDAVFDGLADAFDERHGGFGTAPKFFHAAGIELLLTRAWSGRKRAGEMAVKTLRHLARAGVYDQVGGGFHRYSVDERWHVPHFEKMAYDNAALLGIYANAYALTGQGEFARIAQETSAWVSRVLMDPADPRGFYASQDADVGLHDDGDYFTWTVEEVRAVVGEGAPAVLTYYGVDPVGDMRERPGRNVLHVPKTIDQVAKLTGADPDRLAGQLRKARTRLLAARRKRPIPAIDKTVFVDLNGMMIDAMLTAGDKLGDPTRTRWGLEALERLLTDHRDARGVFAHYRDGDRLRGVGKLADQAWMARALLHAYAVTNDRRYLDAARAAADFILASLTTKDGGFLTAPSPATTHPWAVRPPRSWEDSPTRSAASVAAQALIDLGYLTGQAKYTAAGANALKSFAGAVRREMGTFLAGYAIALEHHLRGPRSIVVVGPAADADTGALAGAARKAYVPNALVLQLDPAVADQKVLIQRLGYAAADRPAAYVCHGKACLRPAGTLKELDERIDQLSKVR